MNDAIDFSKEPDAIVWKVRFHSPPGKVFEALATNEGRKKYWAESAEENQGVIHYVFLNGIEDKGEIIQCLPFEKFVVTYFDCTVTFTLTSDTKGGTDLEMHCADCPEEEKSDMVAGWVSWLLTMKAAVDFNVDLRNHDANRTWYQGYVDN